MSMGTLAMVAEQTGGRLIGPDQPFDSVTIDTRTMVPGQLFFALKGDRFDATEFLGAAADRGAVGAVVEHEWNGELSQVQVEDSRHALANFAKAWRAQFDVPVICITGSNGKTTVKEMTAAIMRASYSGNADAVLVTRGNLNNEIGVPLTVLELRERHRVAVLEIGANHPGEISELAQITGPQVGVITNAARAHLEGFGSLDEVAATKGELLTHLAGDDIAVLNRDDPYFDYWDDLCEVDDQRTFGLTAAADYRAENIRETMDQEDPLLGFTLVCEAGSVSVSLPIAGRHNVMNALAAATASMSAGAKLADVSAGLAASSNISGRLRPIRTSAGLVIYDDSYNANPASVAAAITFLAGVDSPRWLVLGDMGELGQEGENLHREIGGLARDAGIDRLFCVGPLSKSTADEYGEDAEWHASMETLSGSLRSELTPGVRILVKGSRFMGLDKLVEELVAHGQGSVAEGN